MISHITFTVSNNTKKYLIIPNNTQQQLKIPYNTNQYQTKQNNAKQYQTIPNANNTNQYQSIPINTNQYQAIPSNTKQYLTNLVSVGIVNTSSIIANMILVSSWYHHSMALKVLCLTGIVMMPILAIFRIT